MQSALVQPRKLCLLQWGFGAGNRVHNTRAATPTFPASVATTASSTLYSAAAPATAKFAAESVASGPACAWRVVLPKLRVLYACQDVGGVSWAELRHVRTSRCLFDS